MSTDKTDKTSSTAALVDYGLVTVWSGVRVKSDVTQVANKCGFTVFKFDGHPEGAILDERNTTHSTLISSIGSINSLNKSQASSNANNSNKEDDD